MRLNEAIYDEKPLFPVYIDFLPSTSTILSISGTYANSAGTQNPRCAKYIINETCFKQMVFPEPFGPVIIDSRLL